MFSRSIILFDLLSRFTNQKVMLMNRAIYSVCRTNILNLIVDVEDIEEYNAIYDKFVPPYLMGYDDKEWTTMFECGANYRQLQRQEFYRTR